MVHGLPNIELSDRVCEGCVIGKQFHLPFPSISSWRANSPLQLVHTDICGPKEPYSFGGNKYYITFIDDFSRKVWVYFLKEKSAALAVFKQFKALVEIESNCKLCTLRSDRGGEYTSNAFQVFCRDNGIRHQLTTAYTPQRNRIAERKNRTILDMARTLLKEKNLPKQFWAEAVACSAYLLNRCPTKSVKYMTPQEAWSGHKPSVGHLKIFGCLAYAQIPESKRKKLDDRSQKCIFVGYSEESKAYKLYNPLTHKLVVSRDVIFDEAETWDWSNDKDMNESSIFHEDVAAQSPSTAVIANQTSPAATTTTELSSTTQSFPQSVPPSHNASSSNSSSSTESNSSSPPPKMRSLQDIYSTTEEVEEEATNLFCLYADHEPINFEQAVTEDCWKTAMEEEMMAINKNDTWELSKLPPNQQAIGVKWV